LGFRDRVRAAADVSDGKKGFAEKLEPEAESSPPQAKTRHSLRVAKAALFHCEARWCEFIHPAVKAVLDLRPVEFAKHNNAGLVGPAALLSAFGVATWF